MKIPTTINRRLFRLAVILFLVNGPLALHAQSDTTDLYSLALEDLLNVEVITATKTAAKIDDVPSVIEVVTGEQIRQRGYQTLAQLLNDIADNHQDRANWGIGEPVSQNVGFGFRFDTGQNILLLFNGQRLNAFLPGNRFGGEEYLLSNIERIEIIRGPGSALYGSSAFTAVVNIISKHVGEDEDNLIDVKGQYIPTSKGYVLGGTVLSKIGKGSLSSALRYSSEKGQNLDVSNTLFGNQTIKDGVDHAIDGELVYKIKGLNVRSKITTQKRDAVTGFNGVNPSSMKDLELFMYAYSAGADYTFKTSEKTEIKLSGGWHQDNWTEVALVPIFKVSADGTQLVRDANGNPQLDTVSILRNGEAIETSFFIDGQGADTRSVDSEVQFTWNYVKNNHIVLGTYYSDDRILDAYRPTELSLNPLEFVSFQTLRDAANNWLFDLNASRRTMALYTQSDYNITENLLINAGARLDLYSGTGVLKEQKYSEFNPRIGMTTSFEDLGTFKLLYGKATRVPNGFETLSSVSIMGNPENTAERITTFQVQWMKNWSSTLRTELGGFSSTITNRLETNADLSEELLVQGFVGQFVNIGSNMKQKNNGVDGKIIYRQGKYSFMMNFTQYFGSDDGRGNAIAYVPNTMINLDANVVFGWLNVNAGLNYRGGFKQPDTDLRKPVKDYVVGRINLTASPSSRISLTLSGRNIFNSRYQFPSSSQSFTNHFPARGLDLTLGASYKLSK